MRATSRHEAPQLQANFERVPSHVWPPACRKKHVDEALEALRIGLTPYVLQRMEGAFGKKWRSRASPASGDEDDFALDIYALLKTVRYNWRKVFNAEAKLRNARNYIFLALEARNKTAHFVGTIEQREALRPGPGDGRQKHRDQAR
jgi:Swt1-like HEPN